jgi:hypothetical protein
MQMLARLWSSEALRELLKGVSGLLIVGGATFGLLRLGASGEWPDTDSALAAAAITLAGLTALLYFSGGRRRIAIAPFALSDPSAPAVTVKQGTPVPPGVERLPEFQGKTIERPIATQRIVWWEGGSGERTIPAGTTLNDAQAEQAPVIEQRTSPRKP